MAKSVVLVTGANSGIGYGIVERLLEGALENEGDDTTDWSARTVILACRNLDRAQKAKESLISKYFGRRPSLGAAVLVVQQLDLSVPDSVFQACAELATKFTKIDTLFLNAGFIPIKGVDLWAGINNFVTRPSYVAKTGGDVIQQHTGVLTPDGLGDCFTANVFGHWILVRELMKKKLLLSPSNSDTPAGKVIWFSSTTADPDFFDPKDYQCIKGSHPYESSKRLCELLSFHLSKTNDAQSFVCSPGNCQSNIIQGVISAWLLTAVLYFMRFLNLSGINITPINGATAAIYLHESVADDQLDPYKLYHSDITPFGMRWVRELDVPLEDIEGVVTAMDSLAQKFRRRYELSNDKNK